MAGKKIDMCDFYVHDCSQEQNGSPSAFHQSFDNENGRQVLLRKIVEIEKFYYHGNETFLLSVRKGSIRVGN